MLRRLALMLLLAIPQSARATREEARHVVENLLLPAIDLVRVLSLAAVLDGMTRPGSVAWTVRRLDDSIAR
jgi:hypothetical protein